MPRANRYFLNGYVWHLTHRCHSQEHLLKFARDRRRWIRWLYEARSRFGLSVLNYMVTGNHIHLLVQAGRNPLVVAQSMQLVAGRTAQEFNLRKKRSGAFWEGRYHATAVESGKHLSACMAYIDLNMVRAGVVGHPGEWEFCGYHEMQEQPEKYTITDSKSLCGLAGLPSADHLPGWRKEMVEGEISSGKGLDRRPELTESIAVGSRDFVGRVKSQLLNKGFYRKGKNSSEGSVLREPGYAYSDNFDPENGLLRAKNTLSWELDR